MWKKLAKYTQVKVNKKTKTENQDQFQCLKFLNTQIRIFKKNIILINFEKKKKKKKNYHKKI